MVKTGRPKLPKDKRRSVMLRVRITREQHNGIRLAAKKAGLSLPDYVRKTLGGRDAT